MLFSQLNSFLGLAQVGACDEQLLTSRFSCAGEDVEEVVRMSLGAMVEAAVDRVREVDANLL
jgi:hypothetical protein